MSDDRPAAGTYGDDFHFRLLVDSVRDYAIFMLDAGGYVATWNSGAEHLKGYQASEIIGKHVSTFYTAEDRARGYPDEVLMRAKTAGRHEEEGWRVRKDGKRFWANVVITPIQDEVGRHFGFAKITRDFSERKIAEEGLRESDERFRLIIDSVRDYAIFMVDPEGNINSWNPGAERIKGYSADEAIGRHLSIFYSEEDVAAGLPARALVSAKQDGRHEEEGWRLRKNGERYWANVVTTAIYDSSKRLRGFAKVTRDLTEQRRLVSEAHTAEEEARRERERASKAQEAVALRDEFISTASHELRTPIAALSLKLQSMERFLERSASDPKIDWTWLSERIGPARRQTDRLTLLVERLLDVSNIIWGKLDMTFVDMDLGHLIAEISDEFREPAQHAGTEIRVEVQGTLSGQWDRGHLARVLVNLLSNAIKYGAGQPVTIRAENTDVGARLTITDQGIGIAEEDIARIFSRFERAASAQQYGGLGLGLYIAQHIVEAHGGSICVVSVKGQGSTFVVDLPRRAGI